MVWSVSLNTFPVFLAKVDSSLDPVVFSRTSIVESVSPWKSKGWNSTCESWAKIFRNFPTKFAFTVFGSFPICFSNDDFPSFFLPFLREYKISDNPDLSLVKTICLFVRSRSFIVRINLSIFPFPHVISNRTDYMVYSKFLAKLLKRFTYEYGTRVCTYFLRNAVLCNILF